MQDYKTKKLKNSIKTIRGFTLVELSIALIIYSTLMLMIIAGTRFYVENSRIIENDNKIARVSANLRLISEDYPCPADPTLPENAPSYGFEICPPYPLAPAPGSGITIAIGRDSDGIGGGDPILIGAVPIKTILKSYRDFDIDIFDTEVSRRLKTSDDVDAYKRRFTYAVSQSATDPFTLTPRNGVIGIEDEFGNPLINPPSSAHMIVVSHGKNGVGAYLPSGNQIGCALSAPAAGPNNETENCDGDSIFLSGILDQRPSSYFDDLVQLVFLNRERLWSEAATGGGVTFAYNANNAAVGIGTNAPSAQVHVIGDADASEFRTPLYCDRTDPSRCLTAEHIAGTAGTVPDMECPAGQVVSAIVERRTAGPDAILLTADDIWMPSVNCEPVAFVAPTLPFSCPADDTDGPTGALMVGITNLGRPICED